MKFKNISYLILFPVLLTVVFCSKSVTEWKGTIEEVDGVTVVRNPEEPIYTENVFSLEKELSIGEADGPEEYMFSELDSVSVDEEERIYILDSKECHIKVFDKNGIYLKTIGRRGQGPGEFEFPTAIQISLDENIIIHDSRSVIYLSLDGDFLKEIHLTKTGSPQWYSIDSSGNIIGNFAIKMEMVLMKYDSDQELQFTLARVNPFGISGEHSFSPILIYFLVTKDDHIIWLFSNKYELNFVNPAGILIRKTITDNSPIQMTEEDKRIIISKIRASGKIELPKFFQPLEGTDLSMDDDGRLFIRRKQRADMYLFDVYDKEGRYLTKLQLKMASWTSPIWRANKLYTVEEDEDGFQVVKRYKVTWNY